MAAPSNETVSSANERDLTYSFHIPAVSAPGQGLFIKAERGKKREKRLQGAPQKWQEPQLYSSEGLSWLVLPSRCFYSTGHAHSVLDKYENGPHIARDQLMLWPETSDSIGQFSESWVSSPASYHLTQQHCSHIPMMSCLSSLHSRPGTYPVVDQ